MTLVFALKLLVNIRTEGVQVRLFPFVNRTIVASEIKSCEPRKYNPLTEYGGWGVRYGSGGKTYNAMGNLGEQLELQSGERVLIGSQKPWELAVAIKQII